jgi:hypothetical protein
LLSPTYGSAAGLSVGTANPYYVRFAPNGTTSVLAYAMSQSQHSFPMVGNNDVLGYATTGGDGTDPITPLQVRQVLVLMRMMLFVNTDFWWG